MPTPNETAKNAIMGTKQRAMSPADAIVARLFSEGAKKQFEMALPAHLRNNAERYIRSYVTQVRQNPMLQKCNAASLFGAMLTGTALGLDPSPAVGEYYIIPYRDEATFQLSYKGMLQLAYRGGVKKIWAHEVCANDEFHIEWGMIENLVHKPKLDGERGDVIGYYACAELPNGSVSFIYKSKDEIQKHRARYSRAGRSPWDTEFDAMAKKTVAKMLFNWIPKSVDLTRAIAADETVVKMPSPAETAGESVSVFDVPVEHVEELDAVAEAREAAETANEAKEK